MWARIHLIPLLQAEEDRDQVRRHWADKEREKELLGAETKVYNSDRFVRRVIPMVIDSWRDCANCLADTGSYGQRTLSHLRSRNRPSKKEYIQAFKERSTLFIIVLLMKESKKST